MFLAIRIDFDRQHRNEPYHAHDNHSASLPFPPRGGAKRLEASNVKPFDRFGVSVSIDDDALIVGSHQEFEKGNLGYQRAVQV